MIITKVLHRAKGKIVAQLKKPFFRPVIYNANKSKAKQKRCLFLYITNPFRSNIVSEQHQNQWQAKEIARIIGEYGFIVDVADYNNKDVKLRYNYDLVIGLIPRGIDIYSKHMNPGCMRIAYLTSMNLQFTSDAEEKRLNDLANRRGTRLQARRFAGYIQKEIEEFDAAWYIGNSYNFHSYDCFKMPPTFFIKNSGYIFDWATTSHSRSPQNFLFFGSLGAVHKGLDLLLEIFSEDVRDCNLYVCGGYEGEKDFLDEYREELYHSPNIIPIGFVDIESPKYRHLSEICAYTLLPSCAEGCAGSVLTNMSAGIIPIVSKECGFEDDEVINLPDCSKETIRDYIKAYSQKEHEWIENESRKAVEIVNMRYSKSSFTDSVVKAMAGSLAVK